MNKSQNEYYEEAKTSNILSKELIDALFEAMEYTNTSFINWAVDILSIIKTRIDRGDKITDEVSGVVYNRRTYHQWVDENFSPYIANQIFYVPTHKGKIYFTLQELEDEEPGTYRLVIAPSSTEKTYRWISSLSERFSLVEMIATHVVYIKDVRKNSYSPFISGNGKYCRYDEERGYIVEIKD